MSSLLFPIVSCTVASGCFDEPPSFQCVIVPPPNSWLSIPHLTVKFCLTYKILLPYTPTVKKEILIKPNCKSDYCDTHLIDEFTTLFLRKNLRYCDED